MTQTLQTIEVRLVQTSAKIVAGDQVEFKDLPRRHEKAVNDLLKLLLEEGWEYHTSNLSQLFRQFQGAESYWMCYCTEIVIMRWD